MAQNWEVQIMTLCGNNGEILPPESNPPQKIGMDEIFILNYHTTDLRFRRIRL